MILKIQQAIMIETPDEANRIAIEHLGRWLQMFLKTNLTYTQNVPKYSDCDIPSTWKDALKAEVWQKIEPYLQQIEVKPKEFVYDEGLSRCRAKTRADVEKEQWDPRYADVSKNIIEWAICPHHGYSSSKTPHFKFLGGSPDEEIVSKKHTEPLMWGVVYKILKTQLGDKFRAVNVDRIDILRRRNDDYNISSQAIAIRCDFHGRKIGEETRKLKFPKSWHDHFLASLNNETPYETIEIEQNVIMARACPHI